jgi:hypothetical protein
MTYFPFPNQLNAFQWAKEINSFAHAEIQEYIDHNDGFLRSLESDDSSLEEIQNLIWDYRGDYECVQPGSRLIQCGENISISFFSFIYLFKFIASLFSEQECQFMGTWNLLTVSFTVVS